MDNISKFQQKNRELIVQTAETETTNSKDSLIVPVLDKI